LAQKNTLRAKDYNLLRTVHATIKTMEKVVDAIQKKLPAHISSMHWKVGPLQARGSDDSDDDILAQSNSKTFASRQTDYDLMSTDEQVAVATAAAAAAHALELEQQRQRSSPQQGFFLSGIGIKRQQNQSNYQQQHRQPHQPPQVILQEVFQGLRERTPQYMQEIRERTPRYMQEIREKTPQYMQDIRERTPQYVRTAIKNVREQVWQVDYDDGPIYDCDASGRRIQQVSGDGQYSGSLNELEDHYVSSQELRDQPPPYNSNFIPARYEQVWNQFCQNNPRLASKAAAAMNRVAPTTSTAAAASAGSSAEYYVNFSDGDAHKAISAATTNTKSDSSNAKTKNTTTDVSMSGYADMDGIHAHSPPLQPPQQPRDGCNSMADPLGSTPQEQTQEQSKGHASVSSPSRTNHAQRSLPSAAHYQWGAKEHAPDTSDVAHPASSIATSQEAVQPAVVDADENDPPIDAQQSLQEENPALMKVKPEEHSDTDVTTESDNEDDKDDDSEMNQDEDQQPNNTSQNSDENLSSSPPSNDVIPTKVDTNETVSMHSTAKVNWGAAIYKSAPVFRTQNGVM